ALESVARNEGLGGEFGRQLGGHYNDGRKFCWLAPVANMPIYEYICQDCSRAFEALVLGSQKPKCPHCKSARLKQELSVFAVAGSGKSSASDDSAPGACDSCGDPRGPGACSIDDMD